MKKKVVFGIILFFCLVIGSWDHSVDLLVNNKANTFDLSSSNDVDDNSFNSGLQIPFKLQNVPIIVDGNDDFKRKAKRFGWPGDGTEDNPYFIQYYDLTMPPNKKGKKFQLPSAIEIRNTDVYFVIQNNILTSVDGNYIGITLSNVMHGSIIGNDISNFAIGIYIDGCMYIHIEDNDIIGFTAVLSSALLDLDIKFKIEGTAAISHGIFLNPSDYNTILNNRISDFSGNGIYLEESTHNNLIDNDISGGNDSFGIYLNGADWNYLIRNEILAFTSFTSSLTGVKYSVGGVEGTAAISHGIFLNPSHHNYISENTVSDFTDSGMTLEGSTYNDLIDNDIINNLGVDNSRGIYLDGSNYTEIIGNDIFGPTGLTRFTTGVKYSVGGIAGTAAISHGIFLNPSHYNDISGNTIKDFTGDGMYLEGSTNNKLIDNDISGSNESRGIYLNGADSNQLIGNDIFGSTSFTSFATGVKYSVGGVAGTAAISHGIFLNPSHHNYISGNSVSDFTDSGMTLEGSTYNDLIDNDIINNLGVDNSRGIYLDGSNYTEIIGNDIFGPPGLTSFATGLKYSVGGVAGTAAISHGIFLNPSHHNYISGNNIYNNTGNGLYLQGSTENTVEGNAIIGNDENGIFLEGSDTTSVLNNVIYDDDLYGINLDYGSDDNLVSENNIIGNNIEGTSQLLDDGTGNLFNNNFLVDHDNTDADSNDVSDESYPIDGYADNYDYYPWALPTQDLTGIEFADIEAEVDWESETLNLKNLGNYETVKIKFPIGYSVTNIDVSTIKTVNDISAEEEAQVHNARTLIIKFDRTKLIEYLKTLDIPSFPWPFNFSVTGYLNGNFMMFYGSDTVTLIHGDPSDPANALVHNEEPIIHPTQAIINQVVDVTVVGFTQIFSGLTGSLLLLSMISVVTIRKFYRKRRI
ncbi:MAG: nitrous oxide reductase family maturation protein NosD [Candidatus Hodarchaeota archaeon]